MSKRVSGITGVAGAAVAIAFAGIFLSVDRSPEARDTEARAVPNSPARAQPRTIDAPASDLRQAAESKSANAAAENSLDRVNSRRWVDRPVGWPGFSETELRFALQERDAVWSGRAESAVLGSLSQIPDLGLLQADVECRESLCRVQLLFPGRSNTTFALRRIYALSENIGLGPVSSSTGIEVGGLPVLWLFLRRIPVNVPA